MISTKKLIKIAPKWKRKTSTGRTRNSLPKDGVHGKENSSTVPIKDILCSTPPIISVFHYLSISQGKIFQELFRMSEQEFGLQSEGPIRMPCNSVFMEYIIAAFRKGLARDVEKVLLALLPNNCCSAAGFHQEHTGRQLLVCVN